MWCFFSWRSIKYWLVKILLMAYYPLSMAGSYKHYKPFNVEQFLHPNAHVAFSSCRGTFSSYPAPVHKDMFSTRKRRDFVTPPKSTEKFTIQGKHEVFWLPLPAKTSLDSSFQFHFHFLVLSLRFPGDGGTLLWSLSVVTVTAGMTILYGARVSMERCFFWMLWIGRSQMRLSPTKKIPTSFPLQGPTVTKPSRNRKIIGAWFKK